ncbi:MAG: 50S ribosomal protein L6 [Lentisphaeria bacterium]|nr:50S ribosomal protein L6 [Lentisphaeria bacterium]
MSRMGRKPIRLDSRVEVTVDGSEVTVKGPKGSLSLRLPGAISVRQEGGELLVSRSSDERTVRARHGMVRSLLEGMMVGVTEGFRKELELQGVGYRGQIKGGNIVSLSLGFSDPVEYAAPAEVSVTMPDPTHIVVEGISKHLVGQVAAIIRGFRPPDAYHGKGVRYAGEKVSLKEGKTVG